MPSYRFTAARGRTAPRFVTVAAGTAEAQSDTVSINIDVTRLTKGEALTIIQAIAQRIQATRWPPI